MVTETTYTQAQYDGAGRALTRALAELRERTDEVGRALGAVRGMRETDALLRAQVEGLEKLRDGYAKEREEALALVREAVVKIGSLGYSISLDDEPNPDRVTQLAAIDAWLTRADALLGEKDGAK